MDKIKILGICPYEGMRNSMFNIASQIDQIQLDAYVGDLNSGVALAKKAMSEHNYDLIISRGGTAERLSHIADIPLLEISISVGDILQAIKLAENYLERFAIVGFPGITDNANLICSLLQYQIDVFTIHSEDEVAPLLETLKAQGYSMVLCDMIASTIANQNGMNSILITSGEESIRNTFDQAIKFFHSFSKVKSRMELTEAALAASPIHTMAFNQKGELLYSTLARKKDTSPLLNLVKEQVSYFFENDDCDIERQAGGRHVRLRTRRTVVSGQDVVMVYVELQRIPLASAESGISYVNKSDPDVDLNYYYSSANSIGSTRVAIEQCSKSTLPILILGEVGTGKDAAAMYLYENGPYKNAPCCIIDCAAMPEKHWKTLLNAPSSPLSNNGRTLYFKNTGSLTDKQVSELRAFVDYTSLCKRNRVVFSFTVKNGNAENSAICNYLTYSLSCTVLYLPSLRERLKDIPSLSSLYINQLNSQLGKQIIAFEPEAVKLLQQFPWPGNLNQFKRILKELVVTTTQFYITAEQVHQCLQKEELLFTPRAAVTEKLDLNQTLDDINYDIIRLVLEEEHMSQTSAARRLGISRSTIWRILKTREGAAEE